MEAILNKTERRKLMNRIVNTTKGILVIAGTGWLLWSIFGAGFDAGTHYAVKKLVEKQDEFYELIKEKKLEEATKEN